MSHSISGETPVATPAASAARYVYVIACGAGPIKIGISDNPQARLAGLATGSPYELRLVYVARAYRYPEHASDVERRVHATLAAHRLRGEWFTVSESAAIAEIEKEIASTTVAHCENSQKHTLVYCAGEFDSEISKFWPISLYSANIKLSGSGILDFEAVSEMLLARLSLQDAKDLLVVLREEIDRVEQGIWDEARAVEFYRSKRNPEHEEAAKARDLCRERDS